MIGARSKGGTSIIFLTTSATPWTCSSRPPTSLRTVTNPTRSSPTVKLFSYVPLTPNLTISQTVSQLNSSCALVCVPRSGLYTPPSRRIKMRPEDLKVRLYKNHGRSPLIFPQERLYLQAEVPPTLLLRDAGLLREIIGEDPNYLLLSPHESERERDIE